MTLCSPLRTGWRLKSRIQVLSWVLLVFGCFSFVFWGLGFVGFIGFLQVSFGCSYVYFMFTYMLLTFSLINFFLLIKKKKKRFNRFMCKLL
jgi:hypothetical protein